MTPLGVWFLIWLAMFGPFLLVVVVAMLWPDP